MSRVSVEGLDDEPPQEPADGAAPEEHVAPRPPSSSLLGAIAAEVAEDVAEQHRVYPIGKHRRLRARYRALDDHELEQLNRQAKRELNPTGRRKVGKELGEIEVQNRASGLILATACVELLWVDDDGDEIPIHELLARPDQMGDQAPGPLRYDIASLEMLMPERAAELRERLGRTPASPDVALEMHRWGDGANYASARTHGQLLQLWNSAVSTQALEGALEGS